MGNTNEIAEKKIIITFFIYNKGGKKMLFSIKNLQ